MTPSTQRPPPSVRAPRPARQTALWMEEVYGRRWTRRAIAAGAAGMLVVHLFLAGLVALLPRAGGGWFGAPAVLNTGDKATPPKPEEYDIVLYPAEPKPPSLAAPEYVETNPNAPVNAPADTDNFSNRDQQSATPEPKPGEKDEPVVESDSEETSGKILPGSSNFEEREAAAQEPTPPQTQTTPQPDAEPAPLQEEQHPAAGGQDARGDFQEGISVGQGKVNPRQGQLSERDQSRRPGAAQRRPSFPKVRPNPDRPLPRPELVEVPAGKTEHREGGTTRVGLTAINARFSEFGEYLGRMQNAIASQWYRHIRDCLDRIPLGSNVRVRFALNQAGQIVDLQVEDSDAGLTGTAIVRDAILSRAPFGPFTDEMKRTLEETEEFAIVFSYSVE